MGEIKNYLSLVKFSHTIFALPFALVGFFLAAYERQFSVDWWILLKVILCMVFARSAAMAFNRYIDRDIDTANPRTAKVREIPTGSITPKKALIFVILNSLLFVLTTYFINELCFYLSPIALIVILGYSLTKRFTSWCHIVLGVGLSLSPIGAYLAVSGTFSIVPIMVSLVVLTWVAGFDIIYALQDETFDTANNLYSIPVRLGKKNALIFSTFLHVLTIGLLIVLGIFGGFQIIYWIGAGIFSVILIYQHTIVSADNLKKVNLAFFTLNGFASVIFAVFFVLNLYIKF